MPGFERTPVITLPHTSPFAEDKVSLQDAHAQALAALTEADWNKTGGSSPRSTLVTPARRSGSGSFGKAPVGSTAAIREFSPMPEVTQPAGFALPEVVSPTTLSAAGPKKETTPFWDSEMKQPPLIPAGEDLYGRPRVRSGISDPAAYLASQRGQDVPVTGVTDRIFGEAYGPHIPDPDPEGTGFRAPDDWNGGKSMAAGLLTAAEVVNDVNTRVRGLRKNLADDPNDTSDDPTTTYQLKDGQEFTVDDRLLYYKLKDGTVVELGDYEKAIQQPLMYRLPDGREVTTDELVREVYAGEISYEDYQKSLVSQYRLPDGRPLDYDAIPQSEQEWKTALYQYRAPDRKTVLVNLEDGTVPEDLVGNVYMEQRESTEPNRNIGDWLVDKTNLDVANPRAPWQDEAGNNLWDVGRYNPAHSAIDEALPWFIDANLSSVPYYIPKYNILSGAAAAAPYAVGLDGASYQPVGGLDQLGQGTYAPTQLTKGQALGGFLAPLVDAIAERFGDVGIGTKKGWFGPGKVSKFASSALREGFEELASSPFNQLEEVGWSDYGKPKYWNEKTQEWEFDQSKKGGPFAWPAVSTYGGDFASGVAIGGPLEAGSMLIEALKNRGQSEKPQMPEIPSAISRAPQEIQPSGNPLDNIEEL